MTTVTADISITLDGFVAGPNQSEELPFGEGVDDRLHMWAFDHAEENQDEIDAITSACAYIMGRNMFGPGRCSSLPTTAVTHSRWTSARRSRS
jgi:dihydrofolate reductase